MPGTEATLTSSTLGRLWFAPDGGVLDQFSLFLNGDAHLARRVTVRVRAVLADAASSLGDLEGDVDTCAMRAVTRASWQMLRESRVRGVERPLLRLTAPEQQVLFRRLVLGQSIELIATSLQRSPGDVRRLQRHALARLSDEPAEPTSGALQTTRREA